MAAADCISCSMAFDVHSALEPSVELVVVVFIVVENDVVGPSEVGFVYCGLYSAP